MKLLDIDELKEVSKGQMELIDKCIQNRLLWLELREPESDGMVYDTWQEKYDEWEVIAESSEELVKEFDMDDFEELCSLIKDFHYTYGGINRLKVEV